MGIKYHKNLYYVAKMMNNKSSKINFKFVLIFIDFDLKKWKKISRLIFEIRDLVIFIRDSKSREPFRDFESRDLFLISRLEISGFFSHLEINLEKPFSRLPLYLEINFPFRSEIFHYLEISYKSRDFKISRLFNNCEINLENPSRDAKISG